MRAVLIDTGPLFALKDPNDQFHHRAVEDSLRLHRERRSVEVSYFTLAEAYSLIVRRLSLFEGHAWLREMRSVAAFIEPTADDCREAIELMLRYPDQDISLVDAITAVLGQRQKMPVWTYDHDFDTLRADVWR